jgi:hypothetical protein
MSKNKNVLVDLRNKAGITGKGLLAETVIETGDNIARKSDNAVKFNIPQLLIEVSTNLKWWKG